MNKNQLPSSNYCTIKGHRRAVKERSRSVGAKRRPPEQTINLNCTPKGCQTSTNMGSTYHNLLYHWVCSVKERRPLIRSAWRGQFHEYIGGSIRGLQGVPLTIGGVEDHVHALIGLKRTHSLADFVRELKKASSTWAGENHEREFAWQEGYSIFTVNASMMETVRGYINRQEEHHRGLSSKEELQILLKKHGVKYDPAYFV